MSRDPFKCYRENDVQSSSAAGVFIQSYDEVIRLLHSAARAIEAGDIEKKTQDLNRVLTFIINLQGALDFGRGDEAANQLNRFYSLARKQVFEGSARLKPGLLRQAAAYFAEVRKVWEAVRATGSGRQPLGPPPSPQAVSSRMPQEPAPAMTGASSVIDWKG